MKTLVPFITALVLTTTCFGATPIGSNSKWVRVYINPGQVQLKQSQTQQFAAKVAYTTNTAVTWSINPSIGTISSTGLYTAPATITTQQNLKVRATSVANTNQYAEAYVVLVTTTTTSTVSSVSVSVSPGTASLTANQTQGFSATITGTTNTAANWSLSPAVGSISSSGVYTAPASITSTQTVTVKATSAADTTKSAQATVTLNPTATVSVSLSPGTTSLSASQTQSFTPTVGGTSNTAVTWSLSAPVGTISTSGLYQAPSTITTNQTVTVKATSVADTTKSAQSTVTLNPPVNTTTTTVKWPVEVMGAAGTIASVGVTVPSLSVSTPQLSLTIHGLKYETEASVQVNNSAWIAINSTTAAIAGLANNYGGIGGGFHTLKMTINLPAGVVVAGSNTIRFRFEGTDGATSGYRVLAFNFVDASGNALIPANNFVEDDPTQWTPPSTLASDITTGQSLWRTANLTVPVSGGTAPIQAHCMDCHSEDGRDLKYFNYSNNSIVVRSTFHGLTTTQGNQIASYIRSLPITVPPNGRPWNPPYQPGPGLDSQPVAYWSAGAGLSAVLSSDQAMLPYLAPSGSTAGWAANQYLNPRTLPISLQMPDWNAWLPQIHPKDAYGSAFTSSGMNTRYAQIRSSLVPGSASAYAQWGFLLPTWQGDAFSTFLPAYESPTTWTAANRQALYSAALWMMVKNWEINQEYGLEGMPSAVFGAKANVRAWDSGVPFNVSPVMLHMSAGPGIGNGSAVETLYLAYIWYQMQLLLNDGNGNGASQNPIDWNYTQLEVMGLAQGSGAPHGMLELMWLIKALQEMTQLGIGPDKGGAGFQPTEEPPILLVYPQYENNWSATPMSTRITLTQAFLQAYFNQVQAYSVAQYDAGTGSVGVPWASPTEQPRGENMLIQFGGEIWYLLPRMRYIGVSSTLTYQMSSWAQTLWPAGNWALNNGATCTNLNTCTSD